MTDEDLVQQFINGDISAFNTLVWRWQTPVYNLCFRYFACRDDAHDITQRTFIKVYHNIGKLNDHSSFSSWIYRISLNLCRDESRNKHRKYHASLEEYGPDNMILPRRGQQGNPESKLQQKQINNILHKALSQLPEEQREVVIMKEYQELKFTEISEILDQPLSTVKSRMYYGLKALRKILEDWNIDKEVIGYEM